LEKIILKETYDSKHHREISSHEPNWRVNLSKALFVFGKENIEKARLKEPYVSGKENIERVLLFKTQE